MQTVNDVRSHRIPKWLSGVLVVGAATFALGFYLPATQASEKNGNHLRALSGEYKDAVAAYESTHRELTELRRVSRDQKAALGKISSAESSAETALDKLHASVEKALAPQIKAKLLTVQKGTEGVSVVVESMYLIYPHKTFVHAQGQDLLCKVAAGIPKAASRPTQVIAHANGRKPSSSLLAKQFPTSWQLSGVIAADVAEKLQSCGIAGKELQAVGAAHYKGNAKKVRKSPARVEIVVYPAGS